MGIAPSSYLGHPIVPPANPVSEAYRAGHFQAYKFGDRMREDVIAVVRSHPAETRPTSVTYFPDREQDDTRGSVSNSLGLVINISEKELAQLGMSRSFPVTSGVNVRIQPDTVPSRHTQAEKRRNAAILCHLLGNHLKDKGTLESVAVLNAYMTHVKARQWRGDFSLN